MWIDLVTTSGSLSLFSDVFDPSGTSLCGGPYGGPGACDVTAGHAGAMLLEVSDSFGTHTGTFDISIQRLNVGVGCKSLSFGKSPVTGKLKTAASSSCFTFTASPGEYLFARAVGITGTVGRPFMLLTDADGSEPCLLNEGGEQECPLTVGGTDTLLLYSSSAAALGNFRMYVQQMTAPLHCTSLVVGGTGKAAKVTKAGSVACLTFPVVAPETVTATLSGLTGTLQPLIDVFAPTGTSTCANPGVTVSCTLSATGSWTVLVYDNSSAGDGSGTFTATLTSP